ncbi:hypothetical protein JCM8547_001430 [Rhodosporidiobolus lusitaniae]
MLPHSLLVSLLLYAATLATASASSFHDHAVARHVREKRAEDNPDDPEGKTLYITEPACGFYRCTVTWPVGSSQAVNWLGPPAGKVSVSLASNIGGPTYEIVDSIASVSQEGYCDSGYGLGVVAHGHECGRVEFVIPMGWEKMDNYTIVVQSLSDPDLIGYTDMITIAAANSSLTVDNPPSGTSVSLLTIAAPTATNKAASTQWTGKIPAATAVTDAVVSSAAVAATGESSAAGATGRDRSMISSASVPASTEALATVSGASSDASTSASGSVSGTRVSQAASASASATGAAAGGAVAGKVLVALAGVVGAAVLAL